MRRYTVRVLAVLLASLVLPAWVSRCAAAGSSSSSLMDLEIDFRVDEPVFFPGGPVPFALRLKLAPGATTASVPSDWYTGAGVGWAAAGAAAQVTALVTQSTAAMTDRKTGLIVALTVEKRGDTAYLVIRPQDTRAMKDGTYILKAAVDVPILSGGGATVHLDHSAPFEIVSPATSEQKNRLCLMIATYQVENESDLDGAITTVEKGVQDTGAAELNYRLGWLYQSRPDLPKAIGAYEKYIAWARASGGPRLPTGRGPQEIADELEKVVSTLRDRIAGSKAPASP